jgi:hypothetical protein
MSAIAKLLAQKRQLIERLQEDPSPEEREQIEQLLAKINKAMDLLDGAGVSGSDYGPTSMGDPTYAKKSSAPLSLLAARWRANRAIN